MAAAQLQDTGLREDLVRLFREDPRRVAASPGQATTLFGTVTFLRMRSRLSGAGPSVVPAEPIRGLTTGGNCGVGGGLDGLSV